MNKTNTPINIIAHEKLQKFIGNHAGTFFQLFHPGPDK
jgi:hypothetical protein